MTLDSDKHLGPASAKTARHPRSARASPGHPHVDVGFFDSTAPPAIIIERAKKQSPTSVGGPSNAHIRSRGTSVRLPHEAAESRAVRCSHFAEGERLSYHRGRWRRRSRIAYQKSVGSRRVDGRGGERLSRQTPPLPPPMFSKHRCSVPGPGSIP